MAHMSRVFDERVYRYVIKGTAQVSCVTAPNKVEAITRIKAFYKEAIAQASYITQDLNGTPTITIVRLGDEIDIHIPLQKYA